MGTRECGKAREGRMVELKCLEESVIGEVEFASWGTPSGKCFDESTGEFQIGNCHSETSTEAIEDLCLGKQKCSIKASGGVLWGRPPCAGGAGTLRLAVKVAC